MKTETQTFYISGYDQDKSTFNSSTDTTSFSKFIGKPLTNTVHGDIKMNMATYAETEFYVKFDFSSIPRNAIIKSVTVKTKASTTGTGTYIKFRQVRALNDDGWLSSSVTLSSSADTYTISLYSRDWTVEMLESFMLRFYVQRNTRSTTYTYQIQIYSAEVEVEYEYEEGTNFYVKIDGKWIQMQSIYRKINNQWVKINAKEIPINILYLKGN